MKKIIIGLVATGLLASAAVFAYDKVTNKEECCKEKSTCCPPDGSCCTKK
ncbi:MAG: hypothetical protein JST48_08980 [Bacteroidetes bacterium]|nr:hypothetical protein [Bacteroidota bacterium]